MNPIEDWGLSNEDQVLASQVSTADLPPNANRPYSRHKEQRDSVASVAMQYYRPISLRQGGRGCGKGTNEHPIANLNEGTRGRRMQYAPTRGGVYHHDGTATMEDVPGASPRNMARGNHENLPGTHARHTRKRPPLPGVSFPI